MNPNFDKNFNRFAFGALAAWFLILMVNLAIIGAIGYVAWHFISKFW